MVIIQKVINFALMISITEHIEYLMTQHDCVVIPQWGALIAHYKPAQFNSASSTIAKPKRVIAFNPSVNHNDGLLANSLVRRHNISYDQAIKTISDSVSLFKRQLNNGLELPFGHIGFFSLNESGNIEFTPFSSRSSNDQFFGLKSLSFRVLDAFKSVTDSHEINRAQTQRATQATSQQATGNRNLFIHRALQVAASIAIILGIVFVASTPIAVDHSQQNMATMNIPAVKSPSANQETAIASAPSQSAPSQDNTTTNEPIATQTTPSDNGKYYLVISTFTSQAKAQQYIQQHPDIQSTARIWKKGKQFRVYTKRSDDYNALYHEATQLPNSWVTAD